MTVDAPAGSLTTLNIALEQQGRTIPLFTLGPSGDAAVAQESETRMRVTRSLGRDVLPDLKPGAARIVATASRRVFYGLRTADGRAEREVQARFDPPRVGVLSTHHYINLGGSEMVVYRVSPPDVVSGVRVGDLEYPGYPAAGAGVAADRGARPRALVA